MQGVAVAHPLFWWSTGLVQPTRGGSCSWFSMHHCGLYAIGQFICSKYHPEFGAPGCRILLKVEQTICWLSAPSAMLVGLLKITLPWTLYMQPYGE
ncbi:hypothetical protein BDZ91DRAFT_518582 [Kalaharituber pfeilii]|nr:hypothetical protein BDZ91DRAFT_518582 [Kalaharituber pfeilii]